MSIYDSLNKEQKEAVLCTEGPLLILAGAGSGKTRSLTHRIAYLVEEKNVPPWNILAITFTNKAAEEMRERACALVNANPNDLWISTFHAMCSRILRRNIDLLGYDKNFTIYDVSDQKTLMKEVLKSMNIDTKQFSEKEVLSRISSAKNECLSPEEFRKCFSDNYRDVKIAEIYEQYQKRLKSNAALDFDDLLLKTVELFQKNPEVLNYYQERFRYIMVDEYQDTNRVQFKLIELLARKYRNLCVVGDDDQSIYKFRGADIGNILNFEKVFPETKVIRLEQNYRSTKNIINAANSVIKNNQTRKIKKLWTENNEGELVHFRQYQSDYEEADSLVSTIQFLTMRGERYEDMAVLYRTNAQSRLIEDKLKQRGIPYTIVRGVSFYDRKEIKDLMAYLRVVDSGTDDMSVKRIINVPKRGIGQTTVARIHEYAMFRECSFLDAIYFCEDIPGVGRAEKKLKNFGKMIDGFREYYQESNMISDLFLHILEVTKYKEELEAEGTNEARSRLEDIDELLNDIVFYEENTEEPSLRDFLSEKDMYTLNAGIDNIEEDNNKVLLMTLHNAKGLEYDNVFLVGMEEGLFPGFMAMCNDEEEIEEERRLCYVGITRAKKRLYLSCAQTRMLRGQMQYCSPSRFVNEISKEYLEDGEKVLSRRTGNSSYKMSGNSGSSTYSSLSKNPYKLNDFKVQTIEKLDYKVGDRVKHIKFGQGNVLEIVKTGKDYEVLVDFDRVGKKKMFASFARLKKMPN